MFRRGRSGYSKEPSAAGPRSPEFPPLSQDQAEAMTSMLRARLAERGVEAVQSESRDVLVAPQVRIGLQSLAVRLAHTAWAGWPAAITKHADALVEIAIAKPRAVEGRQVLPRLVVDLTLQPSFPPSEPLPGVFLLPAVDLPNSVQMLYSLDQVAHLGLQREVEELAVANLAKLPRPKHHAIPADASPAEAVHAFVATHHFGASNRHWLLVYAPRNRRTFDTALPMLMNIVKDQWSKGDRGPITSDLFYLNGDHREVIQVTDEGGSPVMSLGPAMSGLLARLE
jgi:hypothetical protein